MSRLGRSLIPSRIQVGSVARPSFVPLVNGPSPSGPAMGSIGLKQAGGLFLLGPLADLKLKGAAVDEVGPLAAWWADEVESPSSLGLVGLERDSSPCLS